MANIDENQMQRYRETAKKRKLFEEQKRLQRLDLAWQVARQAAWILHNRFNCRHVTVFGSLIHPDLFHMHSDVDIAVWDIQEHLYLKAVAAVTCLSSEIPVDLIDSDEVSHPLRQLIEKEGQPL